MTGVSWILVSYKLIVLLRFIYRNFAIGDLILQKYWKIIWQSFSSEYIYCLKLVDENFIYLCIVKFCYIQVVFITNKQNRRLWCLVLKLIHWLPISMSNTSDVPPYVSRIVDGCLSKPQQFIRSLDRCCAEFTFSKSKDHAPTPTEHTLISILLKSEDWKLKTNLHFHGLISVFVC